MGAEPDPQPLPDRCARRPDLSPGSRQNSWEPDGREDTMHDSSPSLLRGPGRWLRSVACLIALITVACSADPRLTTKGMPGPSGFAGSWTMLEGAPQAACLIQVSCCCPVPIEAGDESGTLIVELPAKTLLATVSDGVLTMTDATSTSVQDCTQIIVKTWTGVLGSDGRV